MTMAAMRLGVELALGNDSNFVSSAPPVAEHANG